MERAPSLLLTCEHGGNRVPARYRRYFRARRRLLDSHRAYDIGALEAARFLARRLGAPLVSATVTRLVVDLNRSMGHPRLFSAITRPLPAAERAAIIARHYRPYRDAVAQWITRRIAGGGVVFHVAVHSFTPVLDGVVRNADIGLLYDPARGREGSLARAWKARFRAVRPALVVRCNYPYKGVSDGLIPALRRTFPASRYLGIEIEINQRAALGDPGEWRQLLRVIAAAVPTC
jgi:predicted N-formylglutamate amidohydrolase